MRSQGPPCRNPASRRREPAAHAQLHGAVRLFLGIAEVVIEKENTTIIDGAGKGSDIKARIESIRQRAEEATSVIRAQKALEKLEGANEDQTVGIRILSRAIEEPLRQIVENAGEDAAVVLNAVKAGKGAYGYNAGTGEYGDMLEEGILGGAPGGMGGMSGMDNVRSREARYGPTFNRRLVDRTPGRELPRFFFRSA